MGCSYDGEGTATNNVQTIDGESGTFANGMSYSYPAYGVAEGPDSYVDFFTATGNGTAIFKCQGTKTRIVSNFGTGSGGDWRVICSSVTYCAIDTTKGTELISEYYDYLNGASSSVKTVSLGEIKAAMR